jgi:hypothetical protein
VDAAGVRSLIGWVEFCISFLLEHVEVSDDLEEILGYDGEGEVLVSEAVVYCG